MRASFHLPHNMSKSTPKNAGIIWRISGKFEVYRRLRFGIEAAMMTGVTPTPVHFLFPIRLDAFLGGGLTW